MFFGLITFFLGAYGVYGIFSGLSMPIVIGGVASIASNIYGILSGQLRTILPTIFIIFLGVIWSNSLNLPIWVGIFAGLCWESVIFFPFGLIMMFFFGKINE